jgi:hypothetical protein
VLCAVCLLRGGYVEKKAKMKRLILRTRLFYIGAVFGLCVGLAIGLVFTFCTSGKISYDARVDQYQMDSEIFYKEVTK